MGRTEFERFVSALPPQFGAIRQAMLTVLDMRYATTGTIEKFMFPAAEELLDRAAYDYFRGTQWLLTAQPDPYFGPGMHLVSLWEKRLLFPPDGLCYHATPAENAPGIEAEGLRPGNRVGRRSRRPEYPDSVHYIYVSPTEEEARRWIAERFGGDGDWLIYPVRVDGVGVTRDPKSAGGGTCVGFIINADHVPPERLGPPTQVTRPA
jgi:hypothetical protein